MKKATKKILALFLVVAMMTGIFTGCGKDGGDKETTSGDVTISIMVPTDFEDEIRTVLPVFEKANPNIKVADYFYCEEKGAYVLEVDMISKGSSLSQSTVVFQANNELIASFTTNGTNGKVIRSQKRIFLNAGEQRLNALYPENVLSLKRVSIFKEEE